MIEIALKKLVKKHLLIVGGSKSQRQKLIDGIISKANLEYYRFPMGMNMIDEYVNYVRKENLYRPSYDKRGKYGTNQILDFHRDWIAANNSLVIMEELQEMEERWKMDLIETYTSQVQNQKKGEKTIRLIITEKSENGLIKKLQEDIFVDVNEKRTKKQVVDGSIEVIDLA